MSRPLDPRLLQRAPATRRFLLVTGLLQLLGALLIVAQAGLLAAVLAGVFHGEYGHRLLGRLVLLAAAGLGRAGLAAGQDLLAARASVAVRAQLRRGALRAVVAAGPDWAGRQPPGRLVNATGPGLDALDGYVSRALPALVSAAVVPAVVLARIAVADWLSGLLLLLMLPLVPLFLGLVGITTRRRVQRQYLLLARLAGHFLDLLRGLTTLTVYGQAGRQERTLRQASEQYRSQTMSALRIAFLSALALDLVATLSVAVVAVDVGLRLDVGHLSFATALVVLLLAPELFAPLRAVGAQYHAHEAGRVAVDAALELVEAGDAAPAATGDDGRVLGGVVALDAVSVQYPQRTRPALRELSLWVAPGELVALTGRSGAGKSSVLAALLGFAPVAGGRVLAPGRPQLAWLPQRPVPTQPTVAEEVRLGDPAASDELVAEACRQCRAPLPATRLGEDGRSVSAGQRRRIALARALLRVWAVRAAGRTPVLLLDEPSEDLDAATERVVAELLGRLAGSVTILLATHSERLAGLADRRITLAGGRVVAERAQQPARAGLAAVPEMPLGQPETPSARTETPSGQPEPSSARTVPRPAVRELRVRELITAERLWPRLLGAAGLTALAGLAGLGLTATSIWLISRAAEHPNVQALAIAVVGVRTFALGRALLRYLERLVAHDVALRVLVGLRGRVFAALRSLGPAAFGGLRRGDLLRRFVGDVDGLQDGLVRAFLPLAGALVTAAAASVLAAALAPAAGALLAAGLLLAGVLLPWWTGRLAGTADGATGLAALTGRRDAQAAALVDGLAELTAYGATGPALARIEELDAAAGRSSRRPQGAGSTGTALSGAIAALVLPGVLAAGAAAVQAGRLPVIALGVLASCALTGFEAVAPLPAAFASWRRCRDGLRRVAELLASRPAVAEPVSPRPVPAGPLGVAARELAVGPAPGAEPVVRRAAFALRPGDRVAITGPSGSGKSTLLAAALRLLSPAAGSFELTGAGDPVSLAELSAEDLPPAVAGSLQGDHVFDASLRDNLRVVRPAATDAELDRVAARAGLAGFVAGLPDGWSSPAGADGSRLSGGQRQRLLLARALLADPAVLVLDEPTAHLDAETERLVLADLLGATAGRTVLLSTHRRLASGQVGTVLRIDEGRLVTADPIPDAGTEALRAG